MKAKMFKKMISVLCVATIATSCVAPSAGAFRVPENAHVGVANSVNQLNESLGKLDWIISNMIIATRDGALKKCSADDFDRQTELVTLLSSLEASQKRVNELNNVVIYSSSLANELKEIIDDLNARNAVSYGEAGNDDVPLFDGYYFKYAEDVSKKLEEIVTYYLKEHNKSRLLGLVDDTVNKFHEFFNRVQEYRKLREQMGDYGKNNDPVEQDIENAKEWFNKEGIRDNEQYLRKAIEACNKAIDSMNKYANAKQLKGSLGKLNMNISDMIAATRDRALKNCSADDFDRQIRLVTLLSSLEASQKRVNELNEVVIYDLNLANEIKKHIDALNDRIDLTIGESSGIILFDPDYFGYAEATSKKLDSIEKMLKEKNNKK